MGATLNYYAVRDEYTVLIDKVKALEQTYNCLNEQFKTRVSQQHWCKTKSTIGQGDKKDYLQQGMLPGSLSSASISNLYNQHNGYQLDCDEEHTRKQKEAELQRQMMDDLRDLFEKKEKAVLQSAQLKPDFKLKKAEYLETKDKLQDLLKHKESVKEQLHGFLKMYEVKKEATLQQLSHSLQKTDSFKKQHVF